MKSLFDFIVSVFSLSLLGNVVTHVDGFCSLSPFPSSTKKISSFGVSKSSLPTSRKSLNDDDNASENDNDDIFKNMGMNDDHKVRLKKESLKSERFALGKELRCLREDLESLRQNLEWARALNDEIRIESLEKAISKGQSRDPYLMYTKAQNIIRGIEKTKDASDEEKKTLIDKWSSVATKARHFLPQLNMEGLWVGNYGDSKGLQIINITYSGDELIATKVTEDVNVPRGETSFTVNMQPSNITALPPVKLISAHSSRELRRFSGKGQISRKGFRDNRFVEGQMILFETRFSFVWMPTKHHVNFNRPSPEVTLKLLRNIISREDELENVRDHLSRCFEMDLSTAIARHQDPLTIDDPLRRIATQEELEQAEERPTRSNRRNIFFQIRKLRNYIIKWVFDKKRS